MTIIDTTRLAQVIRDVCRADQLALPLHEPCFQGNEWTYVKECIDTGWVSSVGKFVDTFEKKLAEFTGANYAVAVVNGTAALQVSLQLAGVIEGDEVLMPALTFIATANAASYLGAIPHFVDVEWQTLGIDALKLADYLHEIAEERDGYCVNRETGRRIKALVPMHTLGHPCDLDALLQVCLRFHLELVEDAAESLGSYYKQRHTGTFGKLAALSFNGNKVMTTGGGGAILTNDEALAKRAKHLTTTAKVPHRWEYVHDERGYNFRMPNINAALGCAQLEQLPGFLSYKRALAQRYLAALREVPYVHGYDEPAHGSSNFWLNALVIDEQATTTRDEVLSALHEQQIFCRPMWKLMNELPMYRNHPQMPLPISQEIEGRMLHLPSSVKQ
jgi:perosamine synthetase